MGEGRVGTLRFVWPMRWSPEYLGRMTFQTGFPVFTAILLSLSISAPAAESHNFQTSANLASQHRLRVQSAVDAAVASGLKRFTDKKLRTNELAITLIDLCDPQQTFQASYRGNVLIYPASVVKLFYLVAAHDGMENGRLQDSDELRRALRDMIVESSNDATHYVIDALTGTTGGPELPENAMNEWIAKRNAINRYFHSHGFNGINVNQKPWGDGPYGRERVFVGKNYENRNALTTDATARLLMEIIQGRAVSPARSQEMMKLLARDPFKKKTESCEPDQNYDFTGAMPLPSGAKLWSKAGWTSTVRHDAAYLELPNGLRFILVTFTTGHGEDREIIPTIAQKIVQGLRE